MHRRILSIISLAGCLLMNSGQANCQSTEIKLLKAEHHAMQYYLSLPEGWNAKKKWPILVVAEAADKQFKANAERFVEARKSAPYIIVAPIITTNGNYGIRDPRVYPYSTSTWDSIEKFSNCRFDMDGLSSIISDVQRSYSGSKKIFLTGFEAGTHLVWAMVFKHPEMLEAVATIGGNYRGRCMDDNQFSADPSRTNLPIRNFTGEQDKDFGVGGRIYDQYLLAKKLAGEHGYNNITETIVPNTGHVPLPGEVLEYFNSLLK